MRFCMPSANTVGCPQPDVASLLAARLGRGARGSGARSPGGGARARGLRLLQLVHHRPQEVLVLGAYAGGGGTAPHGTSGGREGPGVGARGASGRVAGALRAGSGQSAPAQIEAAWQDIEAQGRIRPTRPRVARLRCKRASELSPVLSLSLSLAAGGFQPKLSPTPTFGSAWPKFGLAQPNCGRFRTGCV